MEKKGISSKTRLSLPKIGQKRSHQLMNGTISALVWDPTWGSYNRAIIRFSVLFTTIYLAVTHLPNRSEVKNRFGRRLHQGTLFSVILEAFLPTRAK